jgi:hypothetical protein
MNSDRNTLFQSLTIWLMSLRRLGALALQLAKNENWKSSMQWYPETNQLAPSQSFDQLSSVIYREETSKLYFDHKSGAKGLLVG